MELKWFSLRSLTYSFALLSGYEVGKVAVPHFNNNHNYGLKNAQLGSRLPKWFAEGERLRIVGLSIAEFWVFHVAGRLGNCWGFYWFCGHILLCHFNVGQVVGGRALNVWIPIRHAFFRRVGYRCQGFRFASDSPVLSWELKGNLSLYYSWDKLSDRRLQSLRTTWDSEYKGVWGYSV